MEWNSGLKRCAKSSGASSKGSVIGNKRKFESELDLKPSANRVQCGCRNMRRKIEELTWLVRVLIFKLFGIHVHTCVIGE